MASLANAVLNGYTEQLEALREDAQSLAGSLTREQFNWRPDASRWSIGQCLQHLTLTVLLYPARIEAMIQEARARAERGERPYREGAFTRWFIRSMEPPPSLRVRTRRKVYPSTDLDPARTLADFDAAHARLAELVAAADGVSLQHGRTASPFFPLLRFTLNQVMALNLAHGRRHLWQALQVLQSPRFPG
jgi:hypothetical protein